MNDVSWKDGEFLLVGDEGVIFHSPDGRAWTPEISNTTKELFGVCRDGPATVAVGGDDTVLVKGASGWEVKFSDFFGGYLTGVAWTGTRYVAVGTEKILLSPGGGRWTPVAGDHPRLGDVVWTGSEVIAVVTGDPSYDGLYVSPDGTAWSHRESGFLAEFDAIAKVGDDLVALGNTGGIYVSSDAMSWSKVRLPGVCW